MNSLSNAELIAVIIRTGQREDTAIDLANRILSIDSSGIGFFPCHYGRTKKIKGIGNCKAAQLLAAIELGKRISSQG